MSETLEVREVGIRRKAHDVRKAAEEIPNDFDDHACQEVDVQIQAEQAEADEEGHDQTQPPTRVCVGPPRTTPT